MPQSTNELRAKMKHHFGDEISEAGPMKYLFDKGFHLHRGGVWDPPFVPYVTSDKLVWDCLDFLADEWDYAYEPNGVKT